jgi:hypothetical protein
LLLHKRFFSNNFQLDNAPGHITAIIKRIIAETGRQIVSTPAGTSGFVQSCDDLINATFQSGFMKVSQ